MIHHMTPGKAVMAMDIATDGEISFAHSRYDTHPISCPAHFPAHIERCVMGELDTDTIGLIVTLILLATLFVAARDP